MAFSFHFAIPIPIRILIRFLIRENARKWNEIERNATASNHGGNGTNAVIVPFG